MNITEDQIKEAAEKSGINCFNTITSTDQFYKGAKWAIEQMQPAWVTVTGIADLPTDDESYWCEVGSQVILLKAEYMRTATGKINQYTPFIKPVPPKK